jgi:hypothetical protein
LGCTKRSCKKAANDDRLNILCNGNWYLETGEYGETNKEGASSAVNFAERTPSPGLWSDMLCILTCWSSPYANPRTYKLTPRIITSRLAPNSFAVTVFAVEKTLLANETVRVMNAVTIVIVHFLDREKFIGFCGSSGPSHPTIWVTGSAHASTCTASSVLDIRFSISIMFSITPSSLVWIEGTRDGTAVLTAVSEGDTHVAGVVWRTRALRKAPSC